MAVAFSLLLVGLLTGNSSAVGAVGVDSPEEHLARIFAVRDAGSVENGVRDEAFEFDEFRAKNAISSTRKKTGSADAIIIVDPLSTAEGGLGNLFTDSGPRRSLSAPIGATRELAKSGKHKAKNGKTKIGKTKTVEKTTEKTKTGEKTTEKTEAGEKTVELEEKIQDLHKQLEQCHLEGEKARDSPDWLFVQMSSQCSFFRQGDSYYVKLFDAADTTYEFTDRPIRLANPISTWMFSKTYDEIFAGPKGFPNGAITFSSSEGIKKPVISVFAGAPSWRSNGDDGNLELTYHLKQEGNQREIFDVANIDESARFHSCSFFIDATERKSEPLESAEQIQAHYESLNFQVEQNKGPEGLVSGGYGLLTKFSDYAISPEAKTNDLATSLANQAFDGIKTVVNLIGNGGSMSSGQIAEASGKLISSIGMVIGPFAGPIGPIVAIVGSLISMIGSFFGGSSSGGLSFTSYLQAIASDIKADIGDNDIADEINKVVTNLPNTLSFTETHLTEYLRMVEKSKTHLTKKYIDKVLSVINGQWVPQFHNMKLAYDSAYTIVYGRSSWGVPGKNTAWMRINSYLNDSCNITVVHNNANVQQCIWKDDANALNGQPALDSKTFLFNGRQNFQNCKNELQKLDLPFKSLTLLAQLYQQGNIFLSQLFQFQQLLCKNTEIFAPECTCPVRSYADNNKFINYLELGPECPEGPFTTFISNLQTLETFFQQAFDLNQEFVKDGALITMPSTTPTPHCGVSTCTDEVWNKQVTAKAGGTGSCGDRINWKRGTTGGELSLEDACDFVATEEFVNDEDGCSPCGALRPNFGQRCDQSAGFRNYWPSTQHCTKPETCNNAYVFVMASDTFKLRWADTGRQDSDYSDNIDVPMKGGQMVIEESYYQHDCVYACENIGVNLPYVGGRGIYIYKADSDDISNGWLQKTSPPGCPTGRGQSLFPGYFDWCACNAACKSSQFDTDYITIAALPAFCPETNSCGRFLKDDLVSGRED